MSTTWVIVVAAGRGARFAADQQGGAPTKTYARLRGARLVDRAVAAAVEAGDGVVLVLAPGAAWDGATVDAVVAGGATRSDSVRAGLAAVPADADVVIVHDAARPLASRALFDAVTAAVRAGADAAVPGVPVVDTVKQVDGVRVLATLPRADLVAVQTPQAFRASVLRDAHREASDASDDAALVEARGGTVVVVPGDEANRKITTAADLTVADALLGASEEGRS
ncbi:MAG TPA: 2-C-methyl-D-erythritol 4-phosphate cytidylyltransferase [Acidimicrobiia bacterium]|nr:2-C-methyl-D-erythritol 4-phosphate cytidylyltransferase [Acidimicrobiia bacterium]